MPSRNTKKRWRNRAAVVSPTSVIGGIGRRRRSSSSSSEEEERGAKWVYLVACHAALRPAYSLFKVDPYAGGDGTPVPIPRHMTRLKAKHDMSFLPVKSRHGSWIVGVGGHSAEDNYGPETIVFDTQTEEVIRGPNLKATKRHPAVFCLGEKVYALSRTPAVVGTLDFLPWFEVLDLSEANVVDGRLENCCWRPLPPPLFFHVRLTPTQFHAKPPITVESSVAVGSYILLSLLEKAGTQAFNTETEQWQLVDDKNLPFSGYAVPHGSLFLGASRGNLATTAYQIKVCPPSPSSSLPGMSTLSITEFPIISEMTKEDIGGFLFFSLGSRCFCLANYWGDEKRWHVPLKRACISLETYQMEDPVSAESMEPKTKLYIKSEIVVSKRGNQVFQVRDSSRGLSSPYLSGALHI